MNPSVIWRRYLHVSSVKHFWKSNAGSSFSANDTMSLQHEKERLHNQLPQVLNSRESMSNSKSLSEMTPETIDQMDSIRARGFLKSRNKYEVLQDVEVVVKEAALSAGVSINSEDWQKTQLNCLESKQKVLNNLASSLRHQVPNSRLHKIQKLVDVVEFYREPVSNITKYAEMARDEQIPSNIAVREHADRFHPEDKHKIHGGITAFPGENGVVLGLRNKRLLPEFNAKKEWYDFEDQSFDYTPVDKGMPWDPEVARKMDRYVTKKFFVNKVESSP